MGRRQLPEGPGCGRAGEPRDIQAARGQLGSVPGRKPGGALHLSETGLSHLKGGSDDFTKDWKAKERSSFASALLMEKFSQIKG